MIIDGVDISKFRLKLGKPPFKIDPNNPGALEKLAEAHKDAFTPILHSDGTLEWPDFSSVRKPYAPFRSPRKTARILTRKKVKSASKTHLGKYK